MPTHSTYITMSDGTRLAADVWLPRRDNGGGLGAPFPTVVHFTPCASLLVCVCVCVCLCPPPSSAQVMQ